MGIIMKTIQISGIIGFDITGKEIKKQLDEANGEDVLVEISSPGGFVFDGLEIFNLLREYKGYVQTKLMGLAASMASYIAMAGKKILIHDNAIFMIHNPWLFSIGDHNDLRKDANNLEALANLLSKAYIKKSNKTESEIKSLMDDETFFYGNEILDNGFADEIIQTEKDQSKEEAVAVAKLSIQNCISTMKEVATAESDIVNALAFIPNISSEEKSEAEENKNNLDEILSLKAEIEKLNSDFTQFVSKTELQNLFNEVTSLKSELDNTEFDSFLNDKIASGNLTPAMKEQIISFCKEISSLNFTEESAEGRFSPSLKVQFTSFIKKFISSFPQLNLFEDFATKPEGSAGGGQKKDESFNGLYLDPQSYAMHKQALELCDSEKMTYLEAIQKLLQS